MLAIKATEEALVAYNSMKLGKKTAYIIFNVKGSDIEAEETVLKADAGDDYLDTFIEHVKKSGEPRFAVVDWNNKLCFISWVPDTAKRAKKMVFATCKEGFIQELVGVNIKIQATDDAELSKDIIVEKTKSNV